MWYEFCVPDKICGKKTISEFGNTRMLLKSLIDHTSSKEVQTPRNKKKQHINTITVKSSFRSHQLSENGSDPLKTKYTIEYY